MKKLTTATAIVLATVTLGACNSNGGPGALQQNQNQNQSQTSSTSSSSSEQPSTSESSSESSSSSSDPFGSSSSSPDSSSSSSSDSSSSSSSSKPASSNDRLLNQMNAAIPSTPEQDQKFIEEGARIAKRSPSSYPESQKKSLVAGAKGVCVALKAGIDPAQLEKQVSAGAGGNASTAQIKEILKASAKAYCPQSLSKLG